MKQLLRIIPSGLYRKLLIHLCIILALVLGCIYGLQNLVYTSLVPREARVEWGQPQLVPETDEHYAQLGQAIAAASREVLYKESKQRDGSIRQSIFLEKDIDRDNQEDRFEGRGLGFRIKTTRGIGSRYRGDYIGHSGFGSVGFQDIDGDASLDLWWCDSGDEHVFILWGNGKGRFVGKQHIGFYRREIPDYHRAAFYDMNGDGRLDLLVKGRQYAPEGSKAPTQYALWWSENFSKRPLQENR